MNLLRRLLTVAALAFALLFLMLLIIWVISTRWYVHANVLHWNGLGDDVSFAGFTAGSLIYGVGHIRTNDAVAWSTIGFHSVAHPSAWGLWLPSESEQRSIVRSALVRSYQVLTLRHARCIPLWIPATLVALAAAACWFSRRMLRRGRAPAPHARISWRRAALKYACVTAGLLSLGLWTLNVVGTFLRTRLTVVSSDVELATDAFGLSLIRGGLHFSYRNFTISPPRFYLMFDDAPYVPRDFSVLGFHLPSIRTSIMRNLGASSTPGRQTIARLPLWIPLLFFALASAYLFARDRGIARREHGCAHCGYDLTGNVTGRCPECGRPIARP